MSDRAAPAPLAWWLNFDADRELELGAGYNPRDATRARLATLVAPGLVAEHDRVLAATTRLPASTYAGRAFCPTPRALAALGRAGAVVPEAPSFAVLRTVNHRGFFAALGQGLPGAAFVRDRAALERALAAPSPTGCFLLKRPFGFAGRGRRRVAPAARGPDDERWLDLSLASGEGLQVEPFVERAGDFGLHAFLARSGALAVGAPTVQETSATGAWLATRRAAPGELGDAEQAALARAVTEAAAALAAAGYFGPFGVDAFRYRTASGALAWNPRCELNARYSMGWAIGMGSARPDRAGDGAR
ncbi:MAG: hypothetical protein IT373_23845 [Polyangiaceae bacterium]|nr:hypothetical protein [Polyangiaceae bacterium]